MRVLIIEDDEEIRSVLQRGLGAEGFDVETCADGATGVWKALEGGYAAIVLDLLLPGKSGYLVCDEIRNEGLAVPILVLSAKSGEFDQIDLLDAGADDFLTKPVSIGVIAARLRALIRRGAALSHNIIERASLRYDMGIRQCTVNGSPVTLTAREDQMLQHLLLANGQCLARQELLEAIWGGDAGVDPSVLDIYVRRLRAKLPDNTIENVRGLGYRISLR